MAFRHLAQIGLAIAAVQRPALAQVYVLKADVSKTAVHLDVAVEDTGVTITVYGQLSRPADASDDNTGRLVGFPAPRQIDRHVVRQILIVQHLHSLAQRTEVRFRRRFDGWLHP